MPMPKTLTKRFTKLQSVHIFKALKESKAVKIHMCLCTMHYAFKENNELCAMLMPSNEHVRNANAAFTHTAQQQRKAFHQRNMQNYKVCALAFK
jgi:hypothetical protein